MIRRTMNRRAFLGGGAAAVGLPFLEAMVPRSARAQANLPKRLIYYFVPNGINMAKFRPATPGADYVTTPILMPLDALKADFSVVTGLENVPAKPDGAGDHAAGTGAFITASHANKSQTAIKNGTSADQVAAQAIGSMTKIPSLQVGINGGGSTGDCDNGYSCAYAVNISWADASTPLPKIVDPGKVFDQIFSGASATETQAAAAKRKAYDQSVLDSVTGDANSLKLKLGKSDNVKLDQYLTGIRELETRLNAVASGQMCTKGTRPANSNDFPTKVGLMQDVMVLAFQCDATRIISFMLGNAISGQTYPMLGVSGGHHDISHHGNDATKLDYLTKIGTWEVQQLANMMTKMKAIKEGDGSTDMLYNSTIFFSSDVSDGNRHNHDDLPVILAGHGGGALKPGRHIQYAATLHQKLSNLLVKTVSTVGATNPVIGDSTAPLPEL